MCKKEESVGRRVCEMPKKNKAKEKAREAYLEKRKLEREAAALRCRQNPK